MLNTAHRKPVVLVVAALGVHAATAEAHAVRVVGIIVGTTPIVPAATRVADTTPATVASQNTPTLCQ
ncbi:hypothetical protein [Odoribacter lunatus]|uniref:hypothetical protein n=1 Tax=Odoribacter lunatus TaxID=2941335 RepID=UPI00203D43EC|nr:hypothetical protein [Odoribacter lunatus]